MRASKPCICNFTMKKTQGVSFSHLPDDGTGGNRDSNMLKAASVAEDSHCSEVRVVLLL